MNPEQNQEKNQEKNQKRKSVNDVLKLIYEQDRDFFKDVLECIVRNVDLYYDDNGEEVMGAYDSDVVECLFRRYDIVDYTNDDIDLISYAITDHYFYIKRIVRQSGDLLYF